MIFCSVRVLRLSKRIPISPEETYTPSCSKLIRDDEILLFHFCQTLHNFLFYSDHILQDFSWNSYFLYTEYQCINYYLIFYCYCDQLWIPSWEVGIFKTLFSVQYCFMLVTICMSVCVYCLCTWCVLLYVCLCLCMCDVYVCVYVCDVCVCLSVFVCVMYMYMFVSMCIWCVCLPVFVSVYNCV